MVDYIKTKIYEKWGDWEKEDTYEYIGNPEYLKGELHFSYIFCSIGKEQIMNYATERKAVLTEEIQTFYDECNGLRLFLSSFSMFGFQTSNEEMVPYDVRTENYNIHARMSENNCDVPEWFFVGSYGDYVFAFDTKDNQCIKCVKNGSTEIKMTFATLEEMLCYFIPRILDRYDRNFYKKNPNLEFKDIPVLANAMFDIDEI